MASRDGDDEARVAREVARLRAEQAIVDELDARAQRAAAAEAQANAERHAKAALAVAKARQSSAAPVVKTKYTGPDPDRASRGNFVSKEELADFQRKYPGATLRDLLNADQGLKRRGAPASSATDMRARGVQGANIAPEQPNPYADTSRVMEGVAAKQREMMRPGRDALEGVYPETALIPAAKLGQMAARAAQAAKAAKNAAQVKKREPELEPRTATRRMQEQAGRYSQEEYVNDIMSRGAEMGYRKGGAVKTYAKGGSVKGSGCEKRGLRKCKIY